MQRGLTTAEAAELAGVAVTTLKRWADQGLLPFERTAGGHRRFARVALERMLREQRSADGSDPLVDTWLASLFDGRRHVIDGELLAARERLGAWYRVADELGVVLSALGRGWRTGAVTIAEEHAASESLVRALHRIGDTLPSAPPGTPCVLTCAPGDEHTLGLGLTELCLREAGLSTLWMGRRTPLEAIVGLVHGGRASMVAVSASSASEPELLGPFATELAAACAEAGVDLLLGGAGCWPRLATASRLRSFEALRAFLEQRSASPNK